jgi:hypothetical protein
VRYVEKKEFAFKQEFGDKSMKKLVLFGWVLFGFAQQALAQGCSVCTKTAAGLNERSARGLNGGIIYLAFLPLVLMGTIGFMWWRRTRNNQA